MRPPIFATLGEVLTNAPRYPFGFALYLPDDEVWSDSTRCALIDPDDVESDEQEEPAAAMQAQLRYALDIGTVKEIFDNLRQQTDAETPPTRALLLEAFLFYYEHDAFIDLSEGT